MGSPNLNSGYGRSMIDNLYRIGKVQNRLLLVCDGSTGANYDMLADLVRVDESGRVRLFTTIAAAVTELQDFDTILIMPGSYVITSNILITESNVKIIGSSGHPGLASVGTYIDATGCDTLSIDGDNVEVANITFVGAAGYWMMDIPGSNASDPSGIWVHYCYFYSTEQGSCKGVSFGNREVGGYGNAISGVIEDCYFFKCGPTALIMDGSRTAIRRNTFITMHANTAAIDYPQSGTQRDSCEIVDNIFIAWGTPNTGKAIVLSGASSPTVGTLWIDGNKFINYTNAAACCNKLSGYAGWNMLGDQFLTDANPPIATTIS